MELPESNQCPCFVQKESCQAHKPLAKILIKDRQVTVGANQQERIATMSARKEVAVGTGAVQPSRVLILGYGVVAQALLPMLWRHFRTDCRDATIIDFADRRPILRPWLDRGLRFVHERVTPGNMSRLLSSHVRPHGLIIDLTWSIDCFDVLEWARTNDVLYVNASVESWDPAAEMHTRSLMEKSLYVRYAQLVDMAPRWRGKTTVVIDHGANPGLISHFVKKGLLDIAESALRNNGGTRRGRERIARLAEAHDFPELARRLEVSVIHCSEWDSQRAAYSKRSDEFVTTWSTEGMWEEAISPSELGWGTHEKSMPDGAIVPRTGPRNQIILPSMGMNTWVRSWVPHQEIVAMIVTHGESFSISRWLTVMKGNRVVYRPTVHYAYLPCNDSILSLHELRCRNYELHPRSRILTDEIVDGKDVVGALIMGHKYRSWWIGSSLSIHAARRKVPHVNATAVQVAAGVLGAVKWTLKNPRQGLCFPEDLPHEEILACALPYLGDFISGPCDWTPLMNLRPGPGDNNGAASDLGNPWQHGNFVFRP